jgi:hypothetical protein
MKNRQRRQIRDAIETLGISTEPDASQAFKAKTSTANSMNRSYSILVERMNLMPGMNHGIVVSSKLPPRSAAVIEISETDMQKSSIVANATPARTIIR